MNNATISPRSCSSMCRVSIGDRIGDQRHYPGHHEDHRDYGELADETVVRPADQPGHDTAPYGETEEEEGRGADNAL